MKNEFLKGEEKYGDLETPAIWRKKRKNESQDDWFDWKEKEEDEDEWLEKIKEMAKHQKTQIDTLNKLIRKSCKKNNFSKDYPIGGMIERYDIEKEKEMMETKPDWLEYPDKPSFHDDL